MWTWITTNKAVIASVVNAASVAAFTYYGVQSLPAPAWLMAASAFLAALGLTAAGHTVAVNSMLARKK